MAFEPMNHIVNGDGVTAENYNKIIDIYNATGKLVRTPVDNSQANQTGEASIEISREGTFVAKNLKGAGGDPAWVRYAKNEAGLDMTATPTPQTKFIGFYSGSVASTNPKDYTWSKYVGKEPSTIILQGQNFIITWDDSTTTTVAIDVSNCKTTEPVSGIVTSVNGQEGAVDIGAISTIFESDKTTVKKATLAESAKKTNFEALIKFEDGATNRTVFGNFSILFSQDLIDEFNVVKGSQTEFLRWLAQKNVAGSFRANGEIYVSQGVNVGFAKIISVSITPIGSSIYMTVGSILQRDNILVDASKIYTFELDSATSYPLDFYVTSYTPFAQ